MKRDWAALVFAMTFPSVMAWLYFVYLAPDHSGAGSTPHSASLAVQVAYGGGKLLQFAFPLVFVWLFDRSQLRPAAPRPQGLALGVGFALVVSAAIFLAYYLGLRGELIRHGVPAKVASKLAQFHLNSPAGFVIMAIFIAVIHSLFEEYYWRWFVFGRLRRHVAVPAAVVISSLAFMAHHVIVLAVYLPGPRKFLTLVVPFSLGVAVGGAVWCWIYQRSGSIYGPWVSHLLIDSAIMAVGYDLLFG